MLSSLPLRERNSARSKRKIVGLNLLALRAVITALRRHYGKVRSPISRDPFQLILWEQVAYLVSDQQRRRAFSALRAETGLEPMAILRASDWLFSAYALLRHHGQELCRRAAPICSPCPLRRRCPSSTAVRP